MRAMRPVGEWKMSKRHMQAPRRQRGVSFSSCKSTEKIVDDLQQERAGVVIDMARAVQSRRGWVTPDLRKPARPKDAPASSNTNGIDHLVPTPQQRDRTIAGMSASFKRNAEARMTKLLTDFRRMRALADKTRYRWADADIDKMEQAAFDEMQETFAAFRGGTGSKKLFSFD